MASTIVNTQKIANESLMLLENSLGFTTKITREYNDQFAQTGGKIGDTLNVRLPVEHTVNTGQKLNIQDLKEQTVPIRVDTQNHVDFAFSSRDLALDIAQFSDRYLKTAVAKLANHIDNVLLAKIYKQVPMHVGVPGTTPTALETYLNAKAKLDLAAIPRDRRYCLIDPVSEVKLVNAMLSYTNPTGAIGKQYLEGSMGRAAGLDFFMDQNIPSHTTATVAATSTPLTNGTTADGATTIVTDGWASGTCTINEGDVISLAGLYAVNPMSKVSTGQLKQFVCTQTISNAATTVNITIPISPAIVLSGANQNCYYDGSVVADGVAVYVNDKTGNTDLTAISAKVSPQNLVFHPDFATLVCVDLPLPPNTDAKRASDKQLGLSLRVISDYSIDADQFATRIDILWGGNVLRPEMACRVSA